MSALIAAAARAVQVLQVRGIPSCVIGGLAVARWGEARLTADVDLRAIMERFAALEEVARDATAGAKLRQHSELHEAAATETCSALRR